MAGNKISPYLNYHMMKRNISSLINYIEVYTATYQIHLGVCHVNLNFRSNHMQVKRIGDHLG